MLMDFLEDELQNVEMAEAERDKKDQEAKIKKRDYTGYDDDEFAPGREGMKRNVLSKYDEFLEGAKETVCPNQALSSIIFIHIDGRNSDWEALP